MRYLRENRSTAFVLGFMLMLIGAAIALSVGSLIVAEVLGDIAYFLLVVGVAIQLVDFIRQERKTGEKALGTH
jgi:hypothetical protein